MSGKFFIIKSLVDNNRVMDITDDKLEDNQLVLTWRETGEKNQLWCYDYIYNVIRSKKKNEDWVLDLDGDKLCVNRFEEGKNTQKWIIDGQIIRNPTTGKVLDVEGGDDDRGADIIEYDYHGEDNQRWTFEYQKRCYFMIKSKLNGKVLDIKDGDDSPGAEVVMWEPTGADNQLWYEDKFGNIYSKLNGLTLDCKNEKLTTATADFTKKKRQWVRCGLRIVDRRNVTEVLDIMDCCEDDGANIGKFEYNGGDNQHWQAKYVTPE